MEQDRFITSVFLRVKATNELLIPGIPYILSLYQDNMTGINYVKLYRYQNAHDGVHEVAHIDTTYPVRSYQLNELKQVTRTCDEMGYEVFKEVDLTNDSQIPFANKVTTWSYKFVNSIVLTK